MKGGFAPFNSSGWSNIVTDEKGNIIDSGNESDEHLSEDENEDFDPTDNMISRRRRRKRSNVKNADDGILVEKTDEPVESIVDNEYFFFPNGGYIEIGCYDWSKKTEEKLNYVDHLKVAINSEEFSKFITDEAFK